MSVSLALGSTAHLTIFESSVRLKVAASDDENRRGDGADRVRIWLSPRADGIMKFESWESVSSSLSSSSSSPSSSLSSDSSLAFRRKGIWGILRSLALDDNGCLGDDVADGFPSSVMDAGGGGGSGWGGLDMEKWVRVRVGIRIRIRITRWHNEWGREKEIERERER